MSGRGIVTGKEKRLIVLLALIILAGILWGAANTRKSLVERAALQALLPYGIGVCHSVPSAKPHNAITWAYATTPEVWWAELEPMRGLYNFSLLDKRVKEWSRSGFVAWISVQTMGVGIDGRRKAPVWLFEEGATWIGGTCANDGMIPPWDEVYQERLLLLLAAINSHVSGWDEEYQSAIAGVIAMSGGMYGEMQVSSCGVKEAMKAHYGLTDAQFNVLYGDAVKELADYYFMAFPDTNVMWQVGYCVTEADATLEQGIVDYLVTLFGERLFVKWAGLDPVCGLDWQRRANQHYRDMFDRLSSLGVSVGYEPAQPDRYQTPIGSGTWDAAKFEEVFGWADEASFICFQPVMFPGLFDVPDWLAFDAALEANAGETTPPEYGKWDVMELFFTGPHLNAKGNDPNPFLDYRLDISFKSPLGNEYVVAGFYAGGRQWNALFTPSETGLWSYTTSFRSGDRVAVSAVASPGESAGYFDGEQGTFIVTESGKKGRLEYSGHYPKFRDGDYYIKAGSNSPEDFLAHTFAPHGGPLGALDYLADEGVNSVYVLLMNLGGDGKNVYPFQERTDQLHYDVEKLADWGAIFKHANERGILLHLVLGEGERANKRMLDDGALGPERKLYYRQMMACFGHLPMVQWNISEEYDLPPMPLSPTKVKSWAAWLAALDPYGSAIITVHNSGKDADPGWRPFLGSSVFSATSLQFYLGAAGNGAEVEKWRALTEQSGRPLSICLDEIRPTSAYNMDDQRREILWPTLLSGGHVEFILDKFLGVNDFREYDDLWRWVGYAQGFMAELPFAEMSPVDGLLVGEHGAGQVFAKRDEIYAIYLPRGGEGELDLADASGRFVGRWYDPLFGNFGPPYMLHAGNMVHVQAPDLAHDWILLVQKSVSPSPTATSSPTPTPMPTCTLAPTRTKTPTPTSTSLPTKTPTLTITPSPTKTKTPTLTITPSPTKTKTLTPTSTPSPTGTMAPTATLTRTPKVRQVYLSLLMKGHPTKSAIVSWREKYTDSIRKEWMLFVCALACLAAVPFVINALARKFGRTLDEERQVRALLYLFAAVVLLVTIFCFWLWG